MTNTDGEPQDEHLLGCNVWQEDEELPCNCDDITGGEAAA